MAEFLAEIGVKPGAMQGIGDKGVCLAQVFDAMLAPRELGLGGQGGGEGRSGGGGAAGAGAGAGPPRSGAGPPQLTTLVLQAIQDTVSDFFSRVGAWALGVPSRAGGSRGSVGVGCTQMYESLSWGSLN
jgi:hypothetical protein